MAKSLEEWIDTDVKEAKERPIAWLSGYYFFRDPPRPTFTDLGFFFSPADGVIVYQEVVRPDDSVVSIKGRPYSLREAMRAPDYDKPSLVIGIFMTFYDVHVNRVPYPGRLSYRSLDALDTYNHPMLDVEKSLLDELRVPTDGGGFLRHNQRVLNTISSPELGSQYYVLQIADYDVDRITPFSLAQRTPYSQGQRFSQIRFGSQVDLIIPLMDGCEVAAVHSVTDHVLAGMDPLVRLEGAPQPTNGKELAS